ncbi:MAG TPA: flavodoxin [bacterium]|nr:flavodoxin [bacterium]HOM27257.1 flavodoxin [bacterium]
MKIIIVYFSLTGNTRKLSVKIYEILKSKNLDVSLFEIESKERCSFLKNCFNAIFEKLIKIDKVPHIENYDLLFIGTPIWAGKITPHIRSFLEDIDLKNKKVFLFTTYGSGFLKNKAMKEFIELVETEGGKIVDMFEVRGEKIEKYMDNLKEKIEKCLKEL